MIDETCTEGDGTQPQAGKGDFRVTLSRGLAGVLLLFVSIDVGLMFVGIRAGLPGGHMDIYLESMIAVYLLARADRIQREGS